MRYVSILLVLLFADSVPAQWEKVAWENAQVNALVKHSADIYCATGNGGVYRSSDGGGTWMQFNEGIEADYYALFTNDLFATENYFILLAEGERQFLRRMKSGAEWQHLTSILDGSYISSLVHVGGDTIVASAQNFIDDTTHSKNGVYLSTNAGTTWEKRSNGLPPALIGVRIAYHQGTVCISTVGYDTTDYENISITGNYYSSDFGLTWNRSGGNKLTDSLWFSLLSSNGSTFVGEAYTYDGSDFNFHGMYRSSDNGMTWVSAMNGIDPAEEYAVTLVPFESQMIVSMTNDNYITTDNGETWQQLLADYSYLTFTGAVRSNGSILLGTFGGVVIPNDELHIATDLSSSNDGLLAWYRIGVFAEENHVYANLAYDSTTEWIASSFDNGEDWSYNTIDPSITISAAPWIAANNMYYAGGRYEENRRAAILTAGSPGEEWLMHSTLPRNGYISSFDIKGDSILAAITGDNNTGYLYFSTNNGTTWKLLNTTPERFRIVKFLGRNMFVTDKYWHPALSYDGGATWDDPFSNNPRFFFTTAVTIGDGFAIAVGNKIDYDNEVIAPEIYRSTDDGLTWKLEKNGIPSDVIFDNAITDKELGIVYVSTDPLRWVYSNSPPSSSVFVSTDRGVSWKKFGEDLPHAPRLFVGSQYVFAQGDHGLYRTPKIFSSVDDEYASHDVPAVINVHPNPTLGSTTITFTLHESDEVRIIVCDLLGKEITELASVYYPAGEHKVHWDAPNMPSGAYTIRLITAHGSVSAAVVKF